jgi:hypothetical protein
MQLGICIYESGGVLLPKGERLFRTDCDELEIPNFSAAELVIAMPLKSRKFSMRQS